MAATVAEVARTSADEAITIPLRFFAKFQYRIQARRVTRREQEGVMSLRHHQINGSIYVSSSKRVAPMQNYPTLKLIRFNLLLEAQTQVLNLHNAHASVQY
jgi:hypothetical protein